MCAHTNMHSHMFDTGEGKDFLIDTVYFLKIVYKPSASDSMLLEIYEYSEERKPR